MFKEEKGSLVQQEGTSPGKVMTPLPLPNPHPSSLQTQVDEGAVGGGQNLDWLLKY